MRKHKLALFLFATGFNTGKPGDVVATTINSPMASTMTFTVPAMSVTNLRLPK